MTRYYRVWVLLWSESRDMAGGLQATSGSSTTFTYDQVMQCNNKTGAQQGTYIPMSPPGAL
jgi:hypothetical protein